MAFDHANRIKLTGDDSKYGHAWKSDDVQNGTFMINYNSVINYNNKVEMETKSSFECFNLEVKI